MADTPRVPRDPRDLSARIGRLLKEYGMSIAAARRRELAWRCESRFDHALLASPDGTETIDATVDDPLRPHDDGGKWRGSVPTTLARLGLIECAGWRPSIRASRHGTPIRVWRIRDRAGLERRLRLVEAIVRILDESGVAGAN